MRLVVYCNHMIALQCSHCIAPAAVCIEYASLFIAQAACMHLVLDISADGVIISHLFSEDLADSCCVVLSND